MRSRKSRSAKSESRGAKSASSACSARSDDDAWPARASRRRVGVVDVGSNSVRLVVFEAATRSPAYFFNEKVLCGLGRDLNDTGALSPEGWTRAMAAIRRFAALARGMRVCVLDGVATAAVREASDGAAFRDAVEAETGLRLRVASGADEARLAAQGVLLGWPGADGLVADLGGASLELARVGDGRVGMGASFALGPLRLAGLDAKDGAKAIDRRVDAELDAAGKLLGARGGVLYLVGGAWRALAKIHMARAGHPIQVLHEYELPAEEMLALADEIAEQTPDALCAEVNASQARLAVMPLGARVLARLIRMAAPGRVAISAFGLREGVLFEHLSEARRAEDPLLSAALAMERHSARFPGFGQELTEWIWPLFPGAPKSRRRLIEAACLLNDVSWNSHPDYRDQACFETVYRANLSGVGHGERAFIGAALRHRYKSSGKQRSWGRALDLLSDADQAEARMLGRAIRLGAMLSGSTPGVLPATALAPDAATLRLRLGPEVAELAGEIVEKRLAALADCLGVAPSLDLD